ncbi:hypothetical protein ATANTOWER_025464 [Ataeniobius toweri]|uniref:Uncharacterized protein n=1 Tax=Ataeniobius toweri TaxID=208326 RepID=A0ABU7CCQ7_9TELE|nr:hypothetical protein [Ataeniobius toweri]
MTLLVPRPTIQAFPSDPDFVIPGLTLFLFPDHRILLSHWDCRPDSPCDITLLLQDDHTEEPKFSFLTLPRILKRGSCAYRWCFPAKRMGSHSCQKSEERIKQSQQRIL